MCWLRATMLSGSSCSEPTCRMAAAVPRKPLKRRPGHNACWPKTKRLCVSLEIEIPLYPVNKRTGDKGSGPCHVSQGLFLVAQGGDGAQQAKEQDAQLQAVAGGDGG